MFKTTTRIGLLLAFSITSVTALPAQASIAVPEVICNATFTIVATPAFTSLPANTVFIKTNTSTQISHL